MLTPDDLPSSFFFIRKTHSHHIVQKGAYVVLRRLARDAILFDECPGEFVLRARQRDEIPEPTTGDVRVHPCTGTSRFAPATDLATTSSFRRYFIVMPLTIY